LGAAFSYEACFVSAGNLGTVGVQGGTSMNVDAKEGEEEDVVDKDVQPVGQDYIEEIKNEDGMLFFPQSVE